MIKNKMKKEQTSISRRSFLKKGLAALAAGIGVSLIEGCSSPEPAWKNKNIEYVSIFNRKEYVSIFNRKEQVDIVDRKNNPTNSNQTNTQYDNEDYRRAASSVIL